MTLFKTKRLLLLLSILVVVGAGVGGLVYVRMRMIRHNYLVARDKGYAEVQKGDHLGVIRDLGTYLSAFPTDRVALEAYAEARLKVEEADGRHLFSAIGAFRRLADLESNPAATQQRLLGLFLQANLNTECVLMADKLLARDPKNAEALHDRAVGLLRLRKFKEALQSIDAYLAIKPEQLDAQVLRLEILSHSGPPEPDLVAEAAKVRKAHPDGVPWKLLQSVACAMAGDAAGSKQWAKESAAGSVADVKLARMRILQLWQTGEIALGDAALEDANKQFDDAQIHLMRVRRLYQTGKFAELVKVAPTQTDTENERAAIHGYQCLGWIALKEPEKAKSLQVELEAKRECLLARDWAAVLLYVVDSSLSQASSRVRVAKEIAPRRQEEACFQMALAAASEASGDFRTAVRCWEAAAIREPAWCEPVRRIAETLMGAGRRSDAVTVGQAAVARDPDDRDALVVLALATATSQQRSPDASEQKALLAMFDNIHTRFPDEQRILALRVSLKTHTLGKDLGIAALQETLNQKPPPSLVTLLQLALVSRRDQLGQETNCFAAAEKLYGMGPDLCYAKAALLADEGHVPEGLALLKENRAKATADRQAWDIAYARFLEANHDSGAKEAWLALGDTYPTENKIQWLVLSAPSIQMNREAAARTIERLRVLIGDTDFSFKLARAKWLLTGAVTGADAVAEATALLTDVTKGAPDMLVPHILLAECRERSQNHSGAIEQLEIAVNLAPDSAPLLIELTRLLQNQGNMGRAGIFLNKLIDRADLSETERQQCAGLLARQGQADKAITLLEKVRTEGNTDKSHLILALLYAQRGKTEQAAAIFDELMKHPNLEIVRMSASFYARHGRLSDARNAIAELKKLKLEPAVVATEEGDFAARFGKPEDAIVAYESAIESAPTNVQIWYRLIGLYLQEGRAKDAQATIERAIAKVPADKILTSLQERTHFIETLCADVRCRPILISLISAPQYLEAEQAVLTRLDKSHGASAPDMQLAIDLTRLADRYPQCASLQNLAVDVNVTLGHLEDAVAIASRAMQTFPASAEPARLAAVAFAASSRWTETLDASNQWRTRSPDQTLAPDVMIGLSYLGMGRPDETLRQIEPYMSQAASDPETYGSVIVLYARSELAKHREGVAEEKLWALAKSSKRGMVSFLQVAGHEAPPEVGKKWLAMAKEELNGDFEVVFAYAVAATELSQKTGDSKIIASALEDLQKLVTSEKGEPSKLYLGYVAIGMLQESQKAPDLAEKAYRRAVELNPSSDVACNNLAMVLARRGELKEALSFGDRAVALSPKAAAFQDTLAFIQGKSGDHADAIAHMRTALQLQPENPTWRINLAQIYLDAGQADKARAMLVNTDGTPYRPEKLTLDLRNRLSQLQQQLGIRL